MHTVSELFRVGEVDPRPSGDFKGLQSYLFEDQARGGFNEIHGRLDSGDYDRVWKTTDFTYWLGVDDIRLFLGR